MIVAPNEHEDGYAAFAAGLCAGGILGDAWVAGAPRFRRAPVVLDAPGHDALADAAERVARVYDELVRIVTRDPSLLDGFFGLTPVQKALWALSAPVWHGVARADVFFTPGGPPVVCELNCDTPSGHPEAALLGRAARAEAAPELRDPNAELEAAICALLARFARATTGAPPDRPLTLGIVYPTELTEDLALVRLYQTWAEARGWRVVLGSPFNLAPAAGPPGAGVALLGTPCELLLRHYKTDWWGERLPIWRDEAPYPDAEPLTAPLAALAPALLARRCSVVNPFAAVLPQNKRAMAFMWERISAFSPASQSAIRAHVPPTFRLEAVEADDLRRDRRGWVLKSDYGCEGDEVIIGARCEEDEWREALAQAIPRRWIAQRYFEAEADAEGYVANHGIYLVAGRRAGLYTRLSRGPTDAGAVSVATLVSP